VIGARGTASALLVTGLLAVARPAAAADPRDPGTDRAGFYFRAGGGPGYTSGSYNFSGLSAEATPRELSFDIRLHGAVVGAHVAVGHSLIDGVALALEGGALVMPVFARHGPLGESTIDGGLLTELGGLVDIYPDLDDAAHVHAGVAFARAAFFGGTNDIGSPENIVEHEAASGPMFKLGVGYELTDSFGLAIRVSFASLNGDHSQYAPLALLVEAAYVRF
jgi:hypothetical protein